MLCKRRTPADGEFRLLGSILLQWLSDEYIVMASSSRSAAVPGQMFSMSMLVVKLLMTVNPANTKAMLCTKVGLSGWT